MQESCNQDCAEQETAVAEWEQLWSAIAAEGAQALTPAVSDRTLRAAGDTAFMRYRNLWQTIDKDTRKRFQMTALANNPQQKLDLLQPLTQTDDAQIRFRALLEIARIQLRLRDLDQARAHTQQALAIPNIAPRISADAYFVLGYTALEQSDLDDAEAALAQAVAQDPGFWDARQIQLLVLSQQLGRSRQGAAACLNRTRQLIENLGAMPILAQSHTQFRDIADRFGAQAAVANPSFHLLAGLGYRWSGNAKRSRSELNKAKQARGRLPRQCEELIMARVDELLAQTEAP